MEAVEAVAEEKVEARAEVVEVVVEARAEAVVVVEGALEHLLQARMEVLRRLQQVPVSRRA